MDINNKIILNPAKYIANIFTRFSLVLFVSLITGGLILSILILTSILNQPYNTVAPSSNEIITVDSFTISELDSLKTSNENSNTTTLPTGRINPFGE